MSDERLRVTLAIVSWQRPDELRDALESAEGQGFDEVRVVDMGSEPPINRDPRANEWVRFDENFGYPRGRNALVEQASGDIVYFVDDDAVLLGERQADVIRELFAADPRLGAIAGLIVRPSGQVESKEFPFTGQPEAIDTARSTAYFVGASHAVRRDAWLEVGGLDDRWFYSMEEIDLGVRLMHKGWTLRYDPAVSVEHRPAFSGRHPSSGLAAMSLRNRLLYCRRNLPLLPAVVQSGFWATYWAGVLFRQRAWAAWWKGVREGLTWPIERDPISWSTARQVHRLGGRVWK